MIFRRSKRRGASFRTSRPPASVSGGWRRRLRWLGSLLVLAGMGIGFHHVWAKLTDPEQFPLRHIRLEGELRHLDRNAMEQLLNGYLGRNFFTLDIKGLDARLERRPWIDYVDIERQWPDTLQVTFREHIPFAHWGDGEIVADDGERFRPQRLQGLGFWPYLAGPDGHESQLIRVYRQASALVDKAGLHLVRLVQDERRAWRMTFANGVELNLGREHLFERLQRFVTIYPRLLAGQIERIAAVDLRYSNGFAVRWKAAG